MSQHNIIFSKNNNEFISELRNKVREYFDKNQLSKYGNSSILLKSIFMTSLYIVPYTLMLLGLIDNMFLFLLSWILMGFGTAGLGMVLMHDANHGSLTNNGTFNKWMGRSLFMLGGFPPNWQYQHNFLHHGFTNIEGHDEDIASDKFLRFSPHTPLSKIHKYYK